MWQTDTIVFLFIGALLVSFGCTLVLLKKPGTLGLDMPDEGRKKHGTPILRLGGLPIFITLCVGYALLAWKQPEFATNWAPIIIGNTLVFLIGFIDDLKPLGAKVKLLGQIGAASVVYAMGVSIDVLSNPIGGGLINLGWLSYPITLLWLIAIPNIINLIDGMDGLATGFGMFLCMTLAFLGHFALMADIVLMSTIMAGALCGFLIFNFPPARIFLGDGGAYLIGFFAATVSLTSSNKGSILASLLVVSVALGIPILDTLFAIVRRLIRGVPIFKADAEHIHHKMMMLGFSKARVLVALYSACLVLSILGISLLWVKGISVPIIGAILMLLAMLTARYLGYVKSIRQMKEQFREALTRRRQMMYTGTYARLIEWEVERCHTAEDFQAQLDHALQRTGMRLTPADGYKSVAIPLSNGTHLTLYVPDEVGNHELWRARAELFMPSLDLAEEKWMNFTDRHTSPTIS